MPYPMTVIEFTPENIRLISGYVKEEKIYLTNSLEGEDLTIEGKLPALREASESLKCLKEKALESIKDLGSVILVLPPFDFEVLSNIDGQEYPSNSDGNLTSSDYQNCFNRILNRARNCSAKGEIIDLHPFSFTIDSSERFEDYPTILRAQSLQVNADIHLIDPDFASFAREVLRRNQIEAKLTFVSSYARYEYLYQQRRLPNFYNLDIQAERIEFTTVVSRRITDAKILSKNGKELLRTIAKELSISMERALELLKTFGFAGDPNFPFQTEEGITLSSLKTAAINAVRDLAQDVYFSLKKTSEPIPMILSGTLAQIEDLDSLFSRLLSINVQAFHCPLFGAKSGAYESMLGALLLANKPYQNMKENTKSVQTSLKRTGFDR